MKESNTLGDIEANLLQPALEILQMSAERLDSLQQSPSPIDQEQLDAIIAQYYMVRLRLVRTIRTILVSRRNKGL